MKTRLTTGVSGTVFHRLFKRSDRRAYTWAMNLMPGDLFNGWEGWNHVLKSSEIDWSPVHLCRYDASLDRSLATPRGFCVCDVTLHAVDGTMHHISETGCVVPAWSAEQMRRFHGGAYFDGCVEHGVINQNGTMLRWYRDGESEEIRKETGHHDIEWDCFPNVVYPKVGRKK